MTIGDFYKEIESVSFQSRFMIFSGFKLVRSAMSRDKTIASLINEVRLNPPYIGCIGKRILFLSAENKDRPGATFDIAIAAYLYSLYMTDQHYAKRMSEFVLQMSKLWWSVDLALHITKNMEMFADLRMSNFKFYGDPTPTEYICWSSWDQPIRFIEDDPIIVNGEELWNMSGQLSVNSPQKTETVMHSV